MAPTLSTATTLCNARRHQRRRWQQRPIFPPPSTLTSTLASRSTTTTTTTTRAAAATAAASSSLSSSSSSSSLSSPIDAVTVEQALSHETLRSLDRDSLRRATAYLDLVLARNGAGLNLTAVRAKGPALLRHCADSLDLLPFLDEEESRWTNDQEEKEKNKEPFTVVDVGSGGGFPGAALAAARPRWRLVLIDALRKRCDAVSEACRDAAIENADVLWSRAEAAAEVKVKVNDADADNGNASSSSSSSSLRERSPVVVARAVAEMRTLAELCLPLVSVGGAWIAPKGPIGGGSGRGIGEGKEATTSPTATTVVERELEAARAAIAALGGSVERVVPLPPLCAGAPGRSVVVVRKVRETPAKYPRGNNLPTRRPL